MHVISLIPMPAETGTEDRTTKSFHYQSTSESFTGTAPVPPSSYNKLSLVIIY